MIMQIKISVNFIYLAVITYIIIFLMLNIYMDITDPYLNITKGNDENRVRDWANVIHKHNLLMQPYVIPGYIGSLHFGSAWIMALLKSAGLAFYHFFFIKLAVKIWLCLKLFATLKPISADLARFIIIFILIYPPFILFSFTFLRDDLGSYLVILTAIYFLEKKYLLGMVLLLICVSLRITYPLLILAYYIAMDGRMHLKLNLLKQKYLISISCIVIFFLLKSEYIPYFVSSITDLLNRLNIFLVFMFLVKQLLSPIGWNVLFEGTYWAYIWWWFTLSFFLKIILLPIFLKKCIIKKWRFPTLLSFLYLLPYLINEANYSALGPRQLMPIAIIYLLIVFTKKRTG